MGVPKELDPTSFSHASLDGKRSRGGRREMLIMCEMIAGAGVLGFTNSGDVGVWVDAQTVGSVLGFGGAGTK